MQAELDQEAGSAEQAERELNKREMFSPSALIVHGGCAGRGGGHS